MPLSVRLTAEEEARLDAHAARTGRSKTFYVRQAIEAHLDELAEQLLLLALPPGEVEGAVGEGVPPGDVARSEGEPAVEEGAGGERARPGPDL
ncbi:MAG: ribbon-helix-helix domain-containing protein [Intrasporangiaceae bacterium]|nr:ribbon-helix-helix domain-containing protein [Intrasporangiaceae bacterium]